MKILVTRFFKIPKDIIYQAVVFLVIFLAAKFGQYIFYGWDTSPAILWPPTGIVLAVMYLWGYRFAPVIFLALFLSTVSGPLGFMWPGSILFPLAQVIGGLAGVYLLYRYDYNKHQTNVTQVLHFLTTIVVASMITPTIITFVGYVMDTLTVPVSISWTRTWAGSIFSCLILFPLITSWVPLTVSKIYPVHKMLELSMVVLLLGISANIIFWTQGQNDFLFLFFGILFICLFWLCLRFSTRMVNLFIVLGTVFGLAGLFIFPDPNVAFATRLFIAELFFLIVIPVFYTFSAVVQDSAKTLSDLAQTKNVIEKENTTKNEFIAVLAHELRNPLAPLKTTLEILELENMSTDIKSHVQNAHRQVHTMQRLLDDLLDITRISQGKFELKITPVNLCTTLAHCVESTKDICQKRQHRVIMDKVCDDSIWLDVDPVRFEQVIVNIINNAAKYTNIGGEIHIRHFVRGSQAILEIQDTGIGISSENIHSIFNSFWQVKKIVPLSSSGIGVGLSLTKQIVEMHGGTITATSDGIDKGSTFILSLPLSTSTTSVLTPLKIRTTPLQSLRILVADDNVAAAKALCTLLALKSHIVESVYCGAEVLTATTDFKPDCVILDIGLPDFNGYVVAQKLRERGYQNKIIALTGYGQKEDIEKALNNGFDLFIIKPVGLKQLEDYFYELAN